MMWTCTRRKWWTGLVALALGAGIAGATFFRPAPAEAVLIGLLLPSYTGPTGLTRADGILIGLLLPAVQKARDPGKGGGDQKPAVPVRVLLKNALTGQPLAQMDTTLAPGGKGAFIQLNVMGDGSVRVKGTDEIQDGTANIFVEQGERLEVAVEAIARVPRKLPAPVGSAQIIDLETNETRFATQLLLPAVQRR